MAKTKKRPISYRHRHVFFRRDADGDAVMLAPANETTMAAVDALSRDHDLRVSRAGEVVVVEHGQGLVVMDSDLDAERWGRDAEEEELVYARGGRDVACPGCEVACPGTAAGEVLPEMEVPPSLSRYWYGISKDKVPDGLTQLSNAMAFRPDGCRLSVERETVDGNTLAPRHVRAVGLEPVSSFAAFTKSDGNMRYLSSEAVRDACAAMDVGTDFSDLDAVRRQLTGGVIGEMKAVNDYRRSAVELTDLSFDDRAVATRLAAQRMLGAVSQAEKSKKADYRRDGCAKCLYGCAHPPWSLNQEPRPLSVEDMLDTQSPLTDVEERELTAFVNTGHKTRFQRPGGGRRVWGIGAWPVWDDIGGLRMVIRRLVPPFDGGFSLPIDDYLAQAQAQALPVTGDERHRRLAMWGLKRLMTYFGGNWYGVRFDKTGGDGGYPSRNDVLAMEVNADCSRITVHSDTRASNDSGAFSYYKGNPITAEDRPRFTTDYWTPFAADIWRWLDIAPQACPGRKK